MFSETLARVQGAPFAPPLVVCNDEHRFLVAEEMRMAGVRSADIILEPTPRNTAPAIAAAALQLAERDPDARILVLPSDHVIEPREAFVESIERASALIDDGRLITFGVVPDGPETGYGYIQRGEALHGGWRVSRFVEKPDRSNAVAYLAQGDFFWNAGIFLFAAKAYLEELDNHHPEIGAAARRAIETGNRDLDFFRLNEAAFRSAPAISIDRAVMEKTDHAAMVPMTATWNDMGSWSSLWTLGEADAAGNVIAGDAVVIDGRDNYIHSDKPLVATIGVEGLVIVATDDTVLVLPMDRSQEVRHLVTALKTSSREEAISHTRVYRPWGHYQNLEAGDGFLVKRIMVKPSAELSLQYHHKRAEHWVVVAGTARVTNGDEVFDLGPNQSTYIPKGAPHRLANPGSDPLHLIEVQSGDYIGEDDIVCLEDSYGRD